MKIFRYWALEEFDLIVNGEKQKFVCSGASNESYEDAKKDCAVRAEKIKLIAQGEMDRETDYQKPIKEVIIKEIDNNNIITRNRYGAEVLNTCSLSIFDIDEYRKSFFEWITFKEIKNHKQAIYAKLKKLKEEGLYPDTTWRVYETARGIRLIIVGKYFVPGSSEFNSFCRLVNVDELYAHLCVKQDCYRARLTPKPARIGIKKIVFKRSYRY